MMKKSLTALLISGVVATSFYSMAAQLSSDKNDELVKLIKHNQMDAIASMVNNGFDVNTLIEGDGTALIIAASHGHHEMVQLLLDLGADINKATESDGSPLTAAATNNQLAIVEQLYQSGAELDAITEHDETALINAARFGHFQVVTYLVDNGADVNLGVNAKTVRGLEYRSPLTMAKTEQIRNYLISQGAKI